MKAPVAAASSERSRIVLVTTSLTIPVALVLIAAIRDWTSSQLPEVVVTALTIAVLDWFPIHLDPAGELRLTTVIAIPTLVLFGWPATFLGAAAGIALGLLHQSPRDVLVSGTERLACLIVATAFVIILPPPLSNNEIAQVIIATLAYAIARTFVVSARMHAEEAIAWSRAVRFLLSATALHLGAFAAVAAVTVWIVRNDPSTTARLLVPVLAATVTLQIYLPRILRGQERRRVLAAVSVLAAAVDAKDPYTANHSAEVAELCQRVARILNLGELEVHRIYLAGLLHDVGKTVVPASILLKPGKLTDEEWEIMRSHVDAGVRIVESIGGLAEVAPTVAASHERLDGRGYPLGLKEDDIPIGSRINLVVDGYNALTTNRPYRAARSSEDAVHELEANTGTQFDPRVVAALRTALRLSRPKRAAVTPPWLTLFRQPAFALLWFGELVSFVGDSIFFVAITLWVLKLTGSATMLAIALVAATVGQGLLGLLAGALADRMDRRGLIIASDIGRAILVAAIPFVLPRSISGGLVLLAVLNVGTVFFRTGVFALMPSVVSRDNLLTANALFQITQRVGEVFGGVLGGAIVLTAGYQMVFYLDALSFVVSAVCVGLMPVAWRAGLAATQRGQISAEIREGLRYIWHHPLHRVLALLIIPGYLTIAFDALQTPMVVKTAGLSALAYGVINSAHGVGKLVSAVVLSGTGKRWVSVPFTVVMFLLTSIATALFGATRDYSIFIGAAFLFGLSNVATNINNATLSMANTPSGILGRLMASRQVFIAATTVGGMLVFGRIADLIGPPIALVGLGLVSGCGVVVVWLSTARQLPKAVEAQVPGGAAD